ncbi:hypothetical protein Lal_00036246 [Lupinus albus]|nr:hypothetical protein Lal_00036246 [Lupinus albus]
MCIFRSKFLLLIYQRPDNLAVANTLIFMITMQNMTIVLVLDMGIHILYRIFLQECPS